MDTKEKEIHESIRRDFRLSQRLRKLNKGYNFININPETRPYKVELVLSVELDLNGRHECLSVYHNLPLSQYRDDEQDFESFLQDFSEWVKRPFYVPRNFNRKDKLDGYCLNGSIHCRRVTVQMSDVTVIVHQVARQHLEREYGEKDFAKVMAELLAAQKPATREQMRAMDRWVLLEERKLYLEKAVEPSNYRHSYSEPEDETQKFIISVEVYNKELKAIEKEMRHLAREREFLNIERVSFHYLHKDEETEDTDDYEADEEEPDDTYTDEEE